MFKNLKLAFKIGGGFFLVLLLTVVITIISIFSLSSLQITSHKNDVTSLIVQTMQTGTVAGKNFVITKTLSYNDEVQKCMDAIIRDATDLRSVEKNKDDIEIFTKIIEGAGTYRSNLSDYVKYEGQKSDVETKVKEESDKLEVLIGKLGTIQGLSLESSSMMTLLYKANYNLAQYLLYKDDSKIAVVQNFANEFLTHSNNLKNRLGTQTGRDLANALIDSATKYRGFTDSFVSLNAIQEESRKKAAEGGALTTKNATIVSDAAAGEMKRLMASTILLVLISAIIAIFIGVCMAILITRSITGAMQKGVVFAEQIAEGDLTAKLDIKQNDEIGKLAAALQNMLDRLTGIVEEINSSARQVAAGSEQLSSTSQQMSQGATEQASSVEEISSSMEEMTSNIKQNADNALQTEKIAQKSAQAAEAGGKDVEATVNAMKEIASKIGIIEEIARSTNMLALNASIEAARAGEYGKGFAVVASEVGKLAERSQKEAAEISKLSTESVNIAEQAGTTIIAMIPDIKRTAELVQEISAASNEQNSGAEQINTAIMQLDKVVQQNASASEESASMSEELASQAEQMQSSMEFFKIRNVSAAKKPDVSPHSSAIASHGPAGNKISDAKQNSVSEASEKMRKSAVTKHVASEKTPESSRLPRSGINITLDDDVKTSGKDTVDNEFQEF